MDDRPEWFAPKRYGFGAGRPISWQGWALVIGFMIVIVAAFVGFEDRPIIALSISAPLGVILSIIAARTTRGGWRWRWGDRD